MDSNINLINNIYDGKFLNDKINLAKISDFSDLSDKLVEFFPNVDKSNFKNNMNIIIKDIFEKIKQNDFTQNNLADFIKINSQYILTEYLNNNNFDQNFISDFIMNIDNIMNIIEIK